MIVEDDDGIIYPYNANDHNNNIRSQASHSQLQHANMNNRNMMAPPQPMGAVPPNDDMVCAAMSILLCPPHEGIAREYHELPPTQQSQVWSDLTGSHAASTLQQEESPEMIQQGFHSLMEQLEKIADSQKTAWNLAMNTCPQYALNPGFLIRFLRAERFDAVATAQRLVLHFQIKQELFGDEKLGREILLQDIREDEDDWDSMQRGFMQVLSKRDYSGRQVIFFYKAITGCYRKRENIVSIAARIE